jgi:IS5 family transposase
MNNNRLSNIELLRIIAMAMVLIIHVGFIGIGIPTEQDIQNAPFPTFNRFLFNNLSIVAVDVFVMISGWFGIHPKFKSATNFLFQVFFFSIIVYSVLIILKVRTINIRGENKAIKEGRGSELWNDKPHKKSHKDVDARWTEKRGEKFYGYKMHAKVDQRHKMVLKYDTTSANVHDSKGYEPLLDESDEGKELYLDAGYESQEPIVERHRMKPVICEKGHRNHPLTDEQKKKNREKSKTRCLVEHVFGFMEQSMCGLIFRRVGILRARADVAMTCLVYNICRYTQIMRLTPVPIA